jgi:hypothetical protein
MTDRPMADRLTREEIQALRFAAHRQLARWSNRRDLQPHRRTQRAALARAVRILGCRAVSRGCELRPLPGNGNDDD